MKWHNDSVVTLEIQISRKTDVPIHKQVAAQIVLQIGSGVSQSLGERRNLAPEALIRARRSASERRGSRPYAPAARGT